MLSHNYDVKSFNLNEFYMEYLKNSIHHKFIAFVLKIVWTLFHDHANVECGFSLDKQLVVENMSETN